MLCCIDELRWILPKKKSEEKSAKYQLHWLSYVDELYCKCTPIQFFIAKADSQQARKPRSYASPKLSPTDSLTGVRCRATSVAKIYNEVKNKSLESVMKDNEMKT